jgi:hypothetical protein
MDNKRRDNYLKRARRIRGNWAKDDYSPNNLAMRILWSDKIDLKA